VTEVAVTSPQYLPRGDDPPRPPRQPPAPAAHSGAEACARAWTTLTAAHARIADHLTSALARHCSLSINDFEILLRLEPAPPPGLRLGDLRSAVRLTQPSLSRAVTRLAQRGWLARASVPDDGRGVLISITQDGRQVLRRAVGVHAQTIREFLLDPLTPAELDLLARALARVADT
jgi:DNA-binding MarR family transcriptional regulator